jgi:alpha-1,6-mannosyltransferase
VRSLRPSIAAGLAIAAAMAGIVVATRHTSAALASPLVPPGHWRAVFVVCALVAIAGWVVAVVLIRHRVPSLRVVLAIAVAIQLAPLLSPLLLSRDAFVYWDYARISVFHHGNPYSDLPAAYPNDPAYARMGSDWHRTYDAYGPLWTLGGQAETLYSGDSPKRAAFSAKVVGALGALFLVGTAAFASRRRSAAAAFVGWCPLVALQLAGGGHNEGWMMGFVLLGIGLTRQRRRPVLGGAAWMAGVGVKWLPLLLVPLELRSLPRDVAKRLLLGLALAAVAGAAVATAFYGVHWIHAAAPISNQLRRGNSLGLVSDVQRLGLGLHAATIVLGVAFAACYLVLLWKAKDGHARLAFTAGLFSLSLAWLAPWYAIWSLAPAAVAEDDKEGRILAVILAVYLFVDAIPR